jgi:hypothetical protein
MEAFIGSTIPGSATAEKAFLDRLQADRWGVVSINANYRHIFK